jgi:hypothetical protein
LCMGLQFVFFSLLAHHRASIAPKLWSLTLRKTNVTYLRLKYWSRLLYFSCCFTISCIIPLLSSIVLRICLLWSPFSSFETFLEPPLVIDLVSAPQWRQGVPYLTNFLQQWKDKSSSARRCRRIAAALHIHSYPSMGRDRSTSTTSYLKVFIGSLGESLHKKGW